MKNNTKILASILLVTSCLTSCTMAPKYKTPEMPVAEEFKKINLDTPIPYDAWVKASSLSWRDFFKDGNLQQILQNTLDNNRDLRVAALNVEAARELYRIQRSDLLPSVNAEGGVSRTKTTEAKSSTGNSYSTSTYSANVATTAFEVDVFGKLRSENQSALEDFFAEEENRNAVQVSLISQTANAYLQWLADKKILKLVDDTLDAQQKSYTLIEKSYKSGVASKLDLAQIRTSLETARVNKALYTRNVEQDKNALVLLMGLKNGDEFFQGDSLDDITLENNLPYQLPSEVLLLRPDVKKAEHILKAANADIGSARANFFPSISLTGTFGFASSDLSDLFSSRAAGAWSFAPQLALPIFKAGANVANLKYANVQKEIAVADYEKSIQVAFKEVSDELVAKKTLKDELEAQHQLVNATQESYDLSYARYTRGIDSFLNVLDAQRSLFTAQQKEVEVQKLLLSNMVNLYKVFGGGRK